jgi:predicted transposase YdaD
VHGDFTGDESVPCILAHHFAEVLGMEESATYQAIVRRGREQGHEEGLEEGRLEGARRFLLLQGEAKFCPGQAAARAALERITDLARLEELGVRMLNAGSWEELLAQPRRHCIGSRRSGG